jgi:hypothetical protein
MMGRQPRDQKDWLGEEMKKWTMSELKELKELMIDAAAVVGIGFETVGVSIHFYFVAMINI